MRSRVSSLVASVVLLAGFTTTAHGQVRARATTDDSTLVTLALSVGGARFEEAKRGRCVHAPLASIYGKMATMWSVDYAPGSGPSLSLTVWRATTGDPTAQMNLSVSAKGKSQRIATVKGSDIVGKGSVQVTRRGTGGVFDIDGTTGDGAAIRGSIACEKFATPAPVGGH